MRAIPYRAIILMGVDASIFPATDERPGFHLLEEKYFLGDPRRNHQERYTILEALISARQHLMISWNSRDERTGETYPPSSPIQHLLNLIKNDLDKNSWEGLLKEVPANPLDINNFLSTKGQEPISCDRRNLDALLWKEKDLETKPIALAIPLQWESFSQDQVLITTNHLVEKWLISPQLVWLEALNIKPKEWQHPIEDLEPLELNELTRYNLLRNRLEDLKEDLLSKKENHLEEPIKGIWEYLNAGNGILPLKAALSIETELLENRWQNLQSTILKIGKCTAKSIEFEESTEKILFADKHALVIDPGRLKSKVVMKAWLLHLNLCLFEQNTNDTIIITRHSSRLKNNQYEISLRFKALKSKAASEIIIKLKALAHQGVRQCWPIPPESGWALAKSREKDPSSGEKAFTENWEGNYKLIGECKKEEMYICFGIDCKSTTLLESKEFKEAFSLLYNPLTENIVT